MNPVESVSVVLPVRDIEHQVQSRIERALEAIGRISQTPQYEVVVVDDGSRDQTSDIARELELRHKPLRLIRHSRPRGIEAAGQTGLERARGELVFIEETNADLRVEDLQRLYDLRSDQTILAARAESCARPMSASLLRRLRAWGTDADRQFQRIDTPQQSSLQMIRRPHLKKLRCPEGSNYRLVGEAISETSTKVTS